jgi:3-deoxy-manno-octulosonate cytidylyltransferase (CMP-KDO synthetase)
MSKTLILVPARFGSSRFPGKPLAKIHNKSMISYVVDNCKKSGFDYAIVTDNDEIEKEINRIGGDVVRVDDDVTTGSERIALAYQRYFKNKNYDFIINVQGDEPLLSGDIISQIGKFHQENKFDIVTAVKVRKSSDEMYLNSNVVKCVLANITNQCLYFSRQSIPFARDVKEFNWNQHIGIYSFKPEALEKFVKFPESDLEKLEKLEQLRALENGLTIGATKIDIELIGVDTPEDIHKIEGVLGE